MNPGLDIRKTFRWLSGVLFQTQTRFKVLRVFSSLRLGSTRSYGTAGRTRNGRVHSELLLLLLKTNMHTRLNAKLPQGVLARHSRLIKQKLTKKQKKKPCRNILCSNFCQTHQSLPHTHTQIHTRV